MVYKTDVPMDQRKNCATPNCTNKQHHKGTYKENGMPHFRKYCAECHDKRVTAKHNLKTMSEVIAKSRGISVREYNNKRSKRRDIKTYCENIDGRLSYICTCTIVDLCQLHRDHIDGDSGNEDPSNIQTLCASCHAYKTYYYGDHLSPGRGAIKENSPPKEKKKPKNEYVPSSLEEFLE